MIQRRLEIAAQAAADPARADLAELALMGSEKVEAFAEGAQAAIQGGGRLAGRMMDAALDEADHAARALADMAAAPSAPQAAAVQAAYAMAWWGRAADQAMTLGLGLARLQAVAAAPARAAVSANARRLSRRA